MKNLLGWVFGKKLCAKENVFQLFPFQGGFEKKKILEDGTRATLTKERRNQLRAMVSEVERLFDCSGLNWAIDGGLSISLLKGEFIGEHRDLDLAVEEHQLEQLQKHIENKGFGLFVTLGVQKRETMVMKRVGWKEFSRADTCLFWIIAVDENGLIQKDKALSFINVHIIRRNKQGVPLNEGGQELPARWFYPKAIEFQGNVLNVASPLKTAYYKLQSLRNYDITDLWNLVITKALSSVDIEEIELVLKKESKNQHQQAKYEEKMRIIQMMKKWIFV